MGELNEKTIERINCIRILHVISSFSTAHRPPCRLMLIFLNLSGVSIVSATVAVV